MSRVKWNGDQVKKNVDDKIIKLLTKAVIMVEKDAKIYCPVDTGRLRASITHEVNKRPLRGIVGSDVEYAIYQELGTYKMNPQPFLRPSLEKNKPEIKAMFGAR